MNEGFQLCVILRRNFYACHSLYYLLIYLFLNIYLVPGRASLQFLSVLLSSSLEQI